MNGPVSGNEPLPADEPILVIDPGTANTTAALVTGAESKLLRDPFSGLDSWPTSVAREGDALLVGAVAERAKYADPACYSGRFLRVIADGEGVALGDRTYPAPELLAAVFGKLHTEAQRLAGRDLGRALLVADGDPAARQAMIAAAGAVGLTDVEFLSVPMAATLARPENRLAERPGRRVLVCDMGASRARLSIVETGDRLGQTVAELSVDACGGDALDEALEAAIRAEAESWLAPRLDAEGASGQRARLQFADFARRIRHQLTDAEETEDYLGLLDPPVRFTRADLDRLMKPALDQVSAGCHDLLAQAGMQPGALATVLLVGGCARIPAVAAALGQALGYPVGPVPDPQLAGVTGGTGWAARAPARQIRALGALPGMRALAWQFEGGAATLAEWLVPVGGGFEPGQTLARLRDRDDAVWELAADRPGMMRRHCAPAGAVVASGDMLAAVRLAVTSPEDLVNPPDRVADLSIGRFVAFGPDSRQVVTMAEGGRALRIWDMETSADVGRLGFPSSARPDGYDAACRADGHWIAAHAGEALEIWDLATKARLKSLGWVSPPPAISLSADGLRVCAAESSRIRVWGTGGQKLLTIRERRRDNNPACVTFSGDGNWVAVMTSTELQIWDVQRRDSKVARSVQRVKDPVWDMTMARDGQRLLLAIGSLVEMIDLPTGERMWSADVPFPIRGADFTPDGAFLATVGYDEDSSSATLWAVDDGRLLHRMALDRRCGRVRISPDGLLMAIGNDKSAAIWSLVL
jgi:molecular chaperone DnaK